MDRNKYLNHAKNVFLFSIPLLVIKLIVDRKLETRNFSTQNLALFVLTLYLFIYIVYFLYTMKVDFQEKRITKVSIFLYIIIIITFLFVAYTNIFSIFDIGV